MQCKQFCNLFIETIDIEPTSSKSWQNNPEIAEQLAPCIQRTYKIIRGNNLRADVCKYRPRVENIKILKNPKKIL